MAMPAHALSTALVHTHRNRFADSHPHGNDGDTFTDCHGVVNRRHPSSCWHALPHYQQYGRVVGI